LSTAEASASAPIGLGQLSGKLGKNASEPYGRADRRESNADEFDANPSSSGRADRKESGTKYMTNGYAYPPTRKRGSTQSSVGSFDAFSFTGLDSRRNSLNGDGMVSRESSVRFMDIGDNVNMEEQDQKWEQGYFSEEGSDAEDAKEEEDQDGNDSDGNYLALHRAKREEASRQVTDRLSPGRRMSLNISADEDAGQGSSQTVLPLNVSTLINRKRAASLAAREAIYSDSLESPKTKDTSNRRMSSDYNVNEKLHNTRRKGDYAREARYESSNYGGRGEEGGGDDGVLCERERMSTALQQQLSLRWLTFANDTALEIDYQRHHSRSWLPRVRRFGVGTTIVTSLFFLMYAGGDNFDRAWNLPSLLMVVGSALPTLILHLRDDNNFALPGETSGLGATKPPLPRSWCRKLSKCYIPCLNRCGLKRCQAEQRLQYLVAAAFAFVSSCHAVRAALDPRAPIHYAFSLTYVHPFYTALFGASGFLGFSSYIVTAAVFTAFHALSFFLVRDLYLSAYGTEENLHPDIRFRQEFTVLLPVNYCVNIIIFGLLNRGHEIASRREFLYMLRMEEENVELVKISVEASAMSTTSSYRKGEDRDMPRSSMMGGGNPFSSILHFTRQLLRGVNQEEGTRSLDVQLENIATPKSSDAKPNALSTQKQRRSTYAFGSSSRGLDVRGGDNQGQGDGRGGVGRAGVDDNGNQNNLERKRGSSWGGTTKQMQQQMPTPKRGSVLGQCATKTGVEAGGVLLRLEDLELMQQLGEGSFGEVFKARLAGVDGLVAAKRAKLHVKKMNLAIIEEVLHECELMYELGKHPHVLPFIGAAVDADGPALYIVSRLMERGSIVDQLYLRKADSIADGIGADSSGVAGGDSRGSSGGSGARRRLGKKVSQAEEELGGCSCEGVKHEYCSRKFELTRLQMAADAADGVAYLHSQNVIHRDLAARNLLVDQDWTVSVADFGLSRMTKGGSDEEDENANGKTQTMIGPIKWESPETWTSGSKVYSTKTDVFSFGVCLYEMFAGGPPWEGVGNIEVATRVLQGERLRFPTSGEFAPRGGGAGALSRVRRGLGKRPKSWRELPVGKAAEEVADERAGGEQEQELKLGESVGKIAAACWLADPQARPMMVEVSKQLAELHQCLSTGRAPRPSLMMLPISSAPAPAPAPVPAPMPAPTPARTPAPASALASPVPSPMAVPAPMPTVPPHTRVTAAVGITPNRSATGPVAVGVGVASLPIPQDQDLLSHVESTYSQLDVGGLMEQIAHIQREIDCGGQSADGGASGDHAASRAAHDIGGVAHDIGGVVHDIGGIGSDDSDGGSDIDGELQLI
jgi:hypothetical protein